MLLERTRLVQPPASRVRFLTDLSLPYWPRKTFLSFPRLSVWFSIGVSRSPGAVRPSSLKKLLPCLGRHPRFFVLFHISLGNPSKGMKERLFSFDNVSAPTQILPTNRAFFRWHLEGWGGTFPKTQTDFFQSPFLFSKLLAGLLVPLQFLR